ncbi:MAG: Asp-tRNA(Asn)/Glu-tRNA(Gln) amidotransferase subunit GatA [Candidatus Taylorbacteria bacterium]|nr:Asp-tRNA(Asn)/Glu-tRNA(Gln) amidotransferase subunit GatA [Candidatus Taylorbacteria bacterium]
MKIDLNTLTIRKVHDALIKGEYSAVDLARSYLSEIEMKNKDLNAYLEVYDDVLEQAISADKRIKNGNATLLTGIPVAVKDNILIKGRRAGSASKILEGYTASYDATVISKLKDAGVVFLGRTNMDEFAMGGSTENSAFGTSKNPHDISRVPGGSSGGSAVAVASNMALVALGSDTGGSIRQPASFCGLVGLKPTYGSVSRHGLMAMASSLDVIGSIAKTVEDAQIIFDCIKGRDPMDSTSIDLETKPSTLSPKPLVVGVPRAFTESEGIDKSVIENFKSSLEILKKQGFEVVDVSLPTIEYSLAVYYIIMPAEASTNLSRFDAVKYGFHKAGKNLLEDYELSRGEGFGKEVRRRIILGTHVLSSGYYDAYYNKAVSAREIIIEDFAKVFKSVDVIATPTTPSPAFKIGEKSDNPLAMYLADIFTVSANIASIPAISVPSGFAEVEGKKLPLGLQFIAPSGGEETLFALSKNFLKK